MDNEAFIQIINEAFSHLVAAYADQTHENIDQGHLSSALQETFQDELRLQVSVFQAMEKALLKVFNNSTLHLDELLPLWRSTFQHTFSQRVNTAISLNMWDFVTPTISMNDLVHLVDTSITVETAAHSAIDILLPEDEIDRRVQNRCMVPAERPEKLNDRDNANFFHICPFCSRIDHNRRKSHVEDHMNTFHYKYSDGAKYSAGFLSTRHLQRVKSSVLLALIKREREFANHYSRRLRAARNSTAELQGREAVEHDPDPFTSNEDLDVTEVPKSKQSAKLARILVRDRRVIMGGDWEAKTRREMERAWAEVEKQGQGLFS